MKTLLEETSQGASSRDISQKLGSVGFWSLISATVLAAFYFATSLYISSHRLLWVDEIATVMITRLPGWTTIWKASTQGVDGLPPSYFWVVGVFGNLFGHSEVAVRLPSALAMTAGLFLTFDCTRRLTNGLYGLIALSVLTCSFLPYYGHEARSYALCFMLAALALWIWICTRSESRTSAVWFGVILFLGVTMHYYAVLCLVPYAVWEISDWKPWRLPSQKMIGGLLGILCAVAILWTPIQGGRSLFPPHYFESPTLDLLRTTFTGFFPDAFILLAVITVWIALVTKEDEVIPLQPMNSAERLGWFFFFIPLVGYVLAEIAHAFQLRYLIGTLPGVAVGFSCWLWRHSRQHRVSLGIFLLLAVAGMVKQVSVVRDPDKGYYSPIRQILNSENSLRNDGKQFFVFCNQARYLEALHYSKHPEEYALLLSLDPGNVHVTMTLARYYPMQLWTLEDLKKHARETALLLPLPTDLDALKQDGFELGTQFSKPLEIVYLK